MTDNSLGTAETASVDKRFDILHQALVEYQQRMISTGLSVAGFILVVIGWLVTSSNVQKLLHDKPRSRVEGAAILLLALIAYLMLSFRVLHAMRALKTTLDELRYMPEAYYGFRLPPPWAAVTFMMLNTMLATVTLLLLFLIEPT